MASTVKAAQVTPAPSALPAPSSRTNPIALRIYKAVGTSFDDPGARAALDIAAGFYVDAAGTSAGPTGSSSTAARQSAPDGLGSGLATGADGDIPPVFKRSLRGQTAALARRSLKRDVERRLASSSQKFLEAFGEVDKKLDVLRAHMTEMQARCDQVQAELDVANSGTRTLLERADGLRAQRASAQLRASILSLFLARFTLSDAEAAQLTSREMELGPPVFAALDKVEQIRFDCRALLGGEEGKVQAGLDIMAATSAQMEAGYNKIFRWCQLHFRQLTRDQVEVSSVMREAVERLRRRPALLSEALDTLTSTRQSSILQSFLDALTRGGPNGLPRPIELHAHDPVRYAGDMLAWVHQATASEHELLESLFGIARARRVGAARSAARDSERTDAERLADDCLDRDLEGLVRPLKLRVGQTVKSTEGVVLAYRIVGLVAFYEETMRRTVGAGAGITRCLEDIQEVAEAAFFDALEAQGRSLLRFLHPPDATLTPPAALRDSAQVLRDVLAVYDTSLLHSIPNEPANGTALNGHEDDAHKTGDGQGADSPEAAASGAQDAALPATGVDRVLDIAVGPMVEMCERMATMRGGWEGQVFLVNCLEYLRHTLGLYDFTAPRLSALDAQMDKIVRTMADEHEQKLLEQSGLAGVVKTMRERTDDTPLSRLPLTSPKPLVAALTSFSAFLTAVDPQTHPRLTLLHPRVADDIHRAALRGIARAYGDVCDRVLDRVEGYEFAETLLRRGRDEVEVALGVAGEAN